MGKNVLWLAILIGLICMAGSCGSEDAADEEGSPNDCEEDDDCGGGEVCRDDRCRDICESIDDCYMDYVCLDGVCLPPGDIDGDISDGDSLPDGDLTDGDRTDGDMTDGDMTDADITDGDSTDGDTSDGDVADGDTTDGDTSDGDTTDGDATDGDTSDGDTTDGDTTDGDTTDGDISDGDVTDGDVEPNCLEICSDRCGELDGCNCGGCSEPDCTWFDLFCNYETPCSETGEICRDCLPYECVANYCTEGPPYQECDSSECDRNSDGNSCDVGEGPYSGTCADGECIENPPTTWVDPATGLEWQIEQSSAAVETLNGASAHCLSLYLDGKDDWRTPTIDELRTTIRGCPATMTGGDCNIQIDGCLAPACRAQACMGCEINQGPNDGCYWPPEFEGNCQLFHYFSRTRATNDSYPARVSYQTGAIVVGDVFVAAVRCVRGEMKR